MVSSYSRYPTPESFKANETDKLQNHSVYYHRLHTPQAEDVLVFSTPHEPKWSGHTHTHAPMHCTVLHTHSRHSLLLLRAVCQDELGRGDGRRPLPAAHHQ
jgi:hypothetical protein